ncbi:MAG: hypothetical protein PsegKO_32030 [Pseudohongiellaceae bacterium]|jgi:chromosome segregation ATPase
MPEAMALEFRTMLHTEEKPMSRKKYEQEIKNKLDELSAEINDLKAHVDKVEHELDDEHHEAFAKIRDLQDDTKRIFHEMREAGDESFHSLQHKMEDYWASLGREVKAFDRKLKDRI